MVGRPRLLDVFEAQEVAMAGRQILRSSGGFVFIALTMDLFASSPEAPAQLPPTPIGISSLDVSGTFDSAVIPSEMVGPGVAAPPPYVPGIGLVPVSNRVEYALIDTIYESVFGDAYNPDAWRPLRLDTFFSDGWFEPWAGGPAGVDGLTPRHGWLGSFEGVFYRLWLTTLTYQNDLNKPFGGNAYAGAYTIFVPFSRRFELSLNVPFVVSNGTEDPTRGYRSDFGDMSGALRFMLSETEAFTQTFNLGWIAPTGQTETGGNLMSVFPRYSFWSNPGGPWVVRGGTGVNVPLNKNDQRGGPVISPGGNPLFGESTSQTAFFADLAIGRYFTPHDVAFGDLVFYGNCNVIVPFEDNNEPTYVGVGPGTRFHIANDYYLLHYWEFPVVGNAPFDYQMQTAILKVF
jgi:hypothetical protein